MKSKEQKRLEALARREWDYARRRVILDQLRPNEAYRRATYTIKADRAAADIRNLRRKLNIREDDDE